MDTPMTALEAQVAFKALAARGAKVVGGDCRVSASLNLYSWQAPKEAALMASLHFDRMWSANDMKVSANADTWEELIERLTADFETKVEKLILQTIRKMALAIIKITAERDQCTSAALRSDGFSDGDVSRYAERAAADANEIAAGGPFSVLATASNHPPVESAA